VATLVCRQGSQPQETASSCFDKEATGWCQEPSSWVMTLTAVPSLSHTHRKKGFITSGRPTAKAFVCPLNFFEGLFLFLSPYHGFLFSLFYDFIKGFCQESVIGDPDLAEICRTVNSSWGSEWNRQPVSSQGPVYVVLMTGEAQCIWQYSAKSGLPFRKP
jgi:hypothetical protein